MVDFRGQTRKACCPRDPCGDEPLQFSHVGWVNLVSRILSRPLSISSADDSWLPDMSSQSKRPSRLRLVAKANCRLRFVSKTETSYLGRFKCFPDGSLSSCFALLKGSD